MAKNCQEINRCNQRGGRMLSIIDLLQAGTMNEDTAAYLLAAIHYRNASFMVGANPGGGGKTTVMGALLNLVPPDCELLPADSLQTLVEASREPGDRRKCWICHEISSGHYYAYLWGEAARAFFALTEQGHVLATNLHADTYEEARRQICVDNGVPEEHFARINLLIFLRMEGRFGRGTKRKIATVYESADGGEHRLVYHYEQPRLANPNDNSRLIDRDQYQKARNILQQLRENGARTIESVRRQLCEFSH